MKTSIKLHRTIFFISIAAVVFIVDQIVKKIVAYSLIDEPHQLIPGFLEFVLVHNSGFVFGILSNTENSMLRIIIYSVSIVSLLFVLVYFIKSRSQTMVFSIGFSFIMGGALGNIFDRITQGHVVDFIDLHINKYHWPTFNIADLFITIGVFLIIVDLMRTGTVKD
ncbi:MAG: signal peptidase II [Candidatus Fischerbacteria bacterium RBG_13_37_8]|uniref:Lipoprotein signal peptidase n=1 Tax=Candidatus Fischerbacteria bacterium RBG_13_37_8 TaxID=1817863 RepID=A0A1F5V614_9BACT|nr:MAG: signal peptidase II [Candidatus Fischerbacteria bacterium RBG_13_37_8]